MPSAWKCAKVTPVHKSGSINDEANYRPISILPVMSKILEKVIYDQLKNYLEENNLLSNQQFGYRAGRSTEIAATLFLDDIRREIESGKMVGAVFMDLSRAFDTISHATLMDKLRSYGLNGLEHSWFNNYISQRTQAVYIDGEYSPEYLVTTGVPQGSLLGPLLFVIYFNDFPDCLTHSKVIMYADDTVIYVAHKDLKVIETTLNQDFVEIADYLNTSELIINLKKGKTECMLFATSKKLSKIEGTLTVKYGDHIINNTSCYEYLGNSIDPSITMNMNFKKRYKKASSRIRLLGKVRHYLTIEAAEKVYNTMIAPLLTYCCIVKLPLSTTQVASLKSIEDRASKILYGKSVMKEVSSISRLRNIRACSIVHKCLRKDICTPMRDYFVINEHNLNTRNKNLLIKLPKIKLELGRQTFLYSGAKLFNDLPITCRKEQDFGLFKELLKSCGFN